MTRRPTSRPGSGVVRRNGVYRIVLDGPPPADLAQRCSGVWREMLDVVEHNRVRRRDAETRANEAQIATPEEMPTTT